MQTAANADLPTFPKFGKQLPPKEDPTRTKTLRLRFVRQVRARWRKVSAAVPAMLTQVATLPPAQRVESFIVLMQDIERETILERRLQPWTNAFIRPAFARGVIRGNLDLRKLSRQTPAKTTAQNAAANVLRLVTNQEAVVLPVLSPDHINAQIAAGQRAEVFELYAVETWQGLSGVTAQVNTQVANVLARSIASSLGPRETAKGIRDRIDKIGVTRSELIARTEVVAANNAGAVAEYAIASDIIGEPVLVQWQATLDNRVRDSHLVRHGKVFTQDEYLSLIGEPHCRCAGLPYIESIEGSVETSSASTFGDKATPAQKGQAKKDRKELGLREVG